MKKSARTDYLSAATASRTGNRARARFRAAALAFVTRVELRDLNLLVGTKRCLLQLDLHVVAQIRSAPPIFRAVAATKECLENSTAKSAAAENFPENLKRVVENAAIKTSAPRSEGRMTKAIICGALVRIHQNIVRFAQLLELFLGVRIIRIFIWMKLNR